MSIINDNKHFFSQAIRERGEQYYNDGRVHLDHADDKSVMAQVLGSEPYDVDMQWKDSLLHISCTCPYAKMYYCKHTYAVLLMIEKTNLLSELQARQNVYIHHEQPENIIHEFDYIEQDFPTPPPQKPKTPEPWDIYLNNLRESLNRHKTNLPKQMPEAPKDLIYVLRQSHSYYGLDETSDLTLNIHSRSRKKNGQWARSKPISFNNINFSQVDSKDAKILAMLTGAKDTDFYSHSYSGSKLIISSTLADVVLPVMADSGKLFFQNDQNETLCGPLTWHPDELWRPALRLLPSDSGSHFTLEAEFHSPTGSIPADSPLLITNQKIMIVGLRICHLEDIGAFFWIDHLKKHKPLEIPQEHAHDFIKKLYSLPNLPLLILPEELQKSEVRAKLRPALTLRTNDSFYYCQDRKTFQASLQFFYEGCAVDVFPFSRGFYSEKLGAYLLRDEEEETNACQTLLELGFKPAKYAQNDIIYQIDSKKFSQVVAALSGRGWQIEADGKLYREAGNFSLNVTTGIDWFELQGECKFEDQKAQLPALLAALRKKENLISLPDGTFGVIPVDVLKKYEFLARMGQAQDGHVRFKKSQVGLLDALLAAQPEATCDALFENTRQQLQNFCGIEPETASDSFQGVLRRYQEEGLGWFGFLRRFGYGGCLADDMGLGKTVQVLALLEKRRLIWLYESGQKNAQPLPRSQPASKDDKGRKTSLVVAPRSIIFNWQKEAARFTPGLKVLDHTGLTRQANFENFNNYDLVLTTYGTLRRDVVAFQGIDFNYVILDEAQSIKNSATVTAKAVRLLKASHRLALSGTPIENHLSELWSLFEFLNPGLLGAASVFREMAADANASSPETRELLSQALRPFILRRTKALVAPELPQKTEQIVYCEMDKTQTKLYNELRDHYRKSLLRQLDKDGIGKSKMHILEALLRLRQAACHPGLLDQKWISSASAKTEFLLPQISEIIEEGHKALIFSQFTSFLAIVKKQLDASGQSYLYLDGKTTNREQLVHAFQEENAAPLFLISLRAGGLGLNLTAAEYVYLLDPWWNPAVEAQAIDRTHRIGQTQQVFAYRLITRNTVEERVLELQQSKRDLFAALIKEDAGLIRSLDRKDLEILLS